MSSQATIPDLGSRLTAMATPSASPQTEPGEADLNSRLQVISIGGSTEPDPAQQPTAEEQAFIKSNPGHKFFPADPKFPNRPPGVYPIGPGNEWRNDPSYEQEPVDLHLVAHTLEGAAEGATAAGLAMLPTAISTMVSAMAGKIADALPAMTKSAKAIGTWAKANPWTAYAVMKGIDKGLAEIGLPKASKIVDALEFPALLLLGRTPSGAEGAAAEEAAAASEGTAAAEGESAAGSESESAEDIVKRQLQQTESTAPVERGPGGARVDNGAAEAEEGSEEGMPSKERRQEALDKYYQEHPEKRPQQKVVMRGPKKGQVKVNRVFTNGEWREVPVYK